MDGGTQSLTEGGLSKISCEGWAVLLEPFGCDVKLIFLKTKLPCLSLSMHHANYLHYIHQKSLDNFDSWLTKFRFMSKQINLIATQRNDCSFPSCTLGVDSLEAGSPGTCCLMICSQLGSRGVCTPHLYMFLAISTTDQVNFKRGCWT